MLNREVKDIVCEESTIVLSWEWYRVRLCLSELQARMWSAGDEKQDTIGLVLHPSVHRKAKLSWSRCLARVEYLLMVAYFSEPETAQVGARTLRARWARGAMLRRGKALPCLPSHHMPAMENKIDILVPSRLGICQKIYRTEFSGERILHTENA